MNPQLSCHEASLISRRGLFGAGVSFFAWAHLPRPASAAGTRDPRLLVIILRGAMDGLSAVAPLGDPDYEALRAGIALRRDGDDAALGLDGFFALHPSLKNFNRLYKDGKALVVHAAASSYRERSHFDGQDVLESGMPGAGRVESGWLNRALALLPKGQRVKPLHGLSIGATTPLILRGSAPVMGWAPQIVAGAGADLAERVLDLYTHRDPALAAALRRGLDTDKLARAQGMNEASARGNPGPADPRAMSTAAQGAAKLMAAQEGPRLAALSFDGWDTHANEGGAKGRLATLLAGLDGAFGALETGMKDVWNDTAVLAITEFGRTARVNGTEGTDHGTATAAFLLGGAVKGGRIIADWPGLKTASLHDGRDLKPTTDLRAVIKGVMQSHLGLDAARLGRDVFPGSEGAKPVEGLTG